MNFKFQAIFSLISLFILVSKGFSAGYIRFENTASWKPGAVYLGGQFESSSIINGSLTTAGLTIQYGINENVLITLDMPYHFMDGAQDNGILGDFSAGVRFFLFQADSLNLRLITGFDFRFPTGVIQEDSYRRVGGKLLSYYPFSIGTYAFAPSIIASILVEPFVINTSLIYHSEASQNETIFSFNPGYDSLDIQTSIDLIWKFNLFSQSVVYRPIFFLDYKYNLSNLPIINNGFSIGFENHLKIENTWKIIAGCSFPLVAGNSINPYNIFIQLGRYF